MNSLDEQQAAIEADVGIELGDDGRMIKPKIEGAVAFNKCWDEARKVIEHMTKALDLNSEGPTQKSLEAGRLLSPLSYNAINGLVALQKSHVITVDPAQVNALPGWDNIFDSIEYCEEGGLPFPTIFFDTYLPHGPEAQSSPGLEKFPLGGGVLNQTPYGMVVIPIGTKSYESPTDTVLPSGYVHFGQSLPEFYEVKMGGGDGRYIFDYPQLRIDPGFLAFATATHEHRQDFDPDLTNEMFNFDDYIGAYIKAEQKPLNAVIEAIPHRFNGDEEMNDYLISVCAANTYTRASRLVEILYFLDTPNIEIVDAPLTRQIRRQAERSGATIAQTIFVKHSQRRSKQRDGDAESIDYSHQFEVRGHWKYYPKGTRTADARPDLLRFVPGRGMCRKIWCPPFVKGPEDAPLVIKTRRLREDP